MAELGAGPSASVPGRTSPTGPCFTGSNSAPPSKRDAVGRCRGSRTHGPPQTARRGSPPGRKQPAVPVSPARRARRVDGLAHLADQLGLPRRTLQTEDMDNNRPSRHRPGSRRPRSGCGAVGFGVRTPLPACRRPPSLCVPTGQREGTRTLCCSPSEDGGPTLGASAPRPRVTPTPSPRLHPRCGESFDTWVRCGPWRTADGMRPAGGGNPT